MTALLQDRRWIRTAIFMMGLLATMALRAEEPAAPPPGADGMEEQGSMCMGGEGGKGMQHMKDMMKEHHDKMAQDLKLDDKQRKLFDDAMEQMHGTMKDGMKDNMSLHQELKELVHADNYDEKQVRAVVQKHNTEREEKIVASANAMHAFHESLSPEQKEKFKAMKSEMRDKMKDRMQEHKAAKASGDAAPAPKHPHEH